MKIIVVRHGESKMNGSGLVQGQTSVSPLKNIGIKQAQKVAKSLKDESINFAYISPLQRAKQTASEILKFHPDVKQFMMTG